METGPFSVFVDGKTSGTVGQESFGRYIEEPHLTHAVRIKINCLDSRARGVSSCLHSGSSRCITGLVATENSGSFVGFAALDLDHRRLGQFKIYERLSSDEGSANVAGENFKSPMERSLASSHTTQKTKRTHF